MNNLSTFKNTGKFVCEKSGLYLVAVHIYSTTNSAVSYIYKNGNIVSRLFIGRFSGSFGNTGTGVVSLGLQTGDVVWIQASSSMYVHNNQYSCLTIIKLK